MLFNFLFAYFSLVEMIFAHKICIKCIALIEKEIRVFDLW